MGSIKKKPVIIKGLESEQKRYINTEINLDLFIAVYNELKKRRLTIRKVIEWGFKEFLIQTNETEARRLGLMK